MAKLVGLFNKISGTSGKTKKAKRRRKTTKRRRK